MNTKFNVKQWAIGSLAVFIIMTLFASILAKLGVEPWAALSAPPLGGAPHDPGTQRILIYLSRVFAAGLFTFVFTKGYEGKPGLGEGLRYGFWIGLLVYVPAFLFGLAVSDLPASSQINQFVKGMVEAIICGVVVGQLYKASKPS